MHSNRVQASCLAICLVLFAAFPAGAFGQAAPTRVLWVSLDDQIIHPVSQRFIIHALNQAQLRDMQCIIIQLDTPGGLLDSTRHIVKEILTSDVPVIVYVAPSGSRVNAAGGFIALAAHVTAMAPGTSFGIADAKPSSGAILPNVKQAMGLFEDNAIDRLLADNVANDAPAWARALAEHRRRNADWVVHAVQEHVSVPASEAKREGVIDLIASDPSDLLTQLHERKITVMTGRTVTLDTEGAIIERLAMSWPERLLNLLANPTLAYLLLLIGFVGVMFEMTHPGVWIPGLLGLVCMVLAFFALQLLPINYAGLGLILLGLLLVALEVKVQSYGMLTVASIASLSLGSAMLIEPVNGIERISWLVIAPVSIALALIALLLVHNVIRAHQRKAPTGMDDLIGAVGRVNGDLRGEGFVHVAGALWKAQCDQPLQDGESVRVTGYKGMTIFVKPT